MVHVHGNMVQGKSNNAVREAYKCELKPDKLLWLNKMIVKPTITYAALVYWPKMKQVISARTEAKTCFCRGIAGTV